MKVMVSVRREKDCRRQNNVSQRCTRPNLQNLGVGVTWGCRQN